MRLLEKAVLLKNIDNFWVDHLEAIDALKEGIGLRGYGQRDPLVEFKKESYVLFQKLLNNIQEGVAQTIYRVELSSQTENKVTEELPQEYHANWSGGDNVSSTSSFLATNEPSLIKKKKVGRNDPCPCGSGKKYKKCCGR